MGPLLVFLVFTRVFFVYVTCVCVCVAGPFLLYFAWGFIDLTISSWNYWIMGQMTDDLQLLGRLVIYNETTRKEMQCLHLVHRR